MPVLHRIRRQRWQVSAPSPAAALAARRYLRQANDDALLPALATAFDAAAGEAEVLRIARLELSVRVSSAECLADELPRLLAEAARQALSGRRARAGGGDPAPVSIRAAPDWRQGLRHYLITGQVDWFDSHRASEDLQGELAAEAIHWSRAPAEALHRLAELPSVRLDIALFRLLQWLPGDELARWADYVRTAAPVDDAPWLDELLAWQAGATRDPALRLLVLSILLVCAMPAAVRPLAPTVEEGAGAAIAAAYSAAFDAWPTAGRGPWAAIEKRIAALSRAAPVAFAATPSAMSSALPAAMPSGSADVQCAAGEQSAVRPGLRDDLQAAPGLPVFAAGIVLLHPWLPRLFAALGWVADPPSRATPFPSPRLPQALALLHWLATGRDEPFEFELGVAKLLLGLTPDAPLPVAGGLLDDTARREGLALLDAVVGHWSALGHTRADGLRVAFLQRSGLLQDEDDHWLLRVQSESYDLLLARLPWAIGIVRLPWMSLPVHVEWTAP